MKRRRNFSNSDSSDNESPSTSFSSCGKYRSKSKLSANEQKRPAEVFRKDLISAMKIPDSQHINLDDYYLFVDTWKQEWEKGVQVPASPDIVLQPSLRVIAEKVKEVLYSRPRKYIHCSSPEPAEYGYINILEMAENTCRYDLDDMDIFWLQELNDELAEMGCGAVDESMMEKTIEVLERKCYENMNHAIETEEGLGIEYDEDVICDVCRSPDSEEGNDMVFCDRCNICVHQACYGILKVPEGSWLCRSCVLGIHPQCLLCPKKGGAMKATRTGTKWAHVSCALWIPEVSIACPERMEPITKVSHIPPRRWALVCSLCKLKIGACIQCSVKSCITAFHVTCAFEHNLEMKTILDEGDEVKFKSFCLKHSKNNQSSLLDTESAPKGGAELKQKDREKNNFRAQKLQELQEEFYTLVKVEDVAVETGLPPLTVNFIYKYWKLKRKSNFNKPLLSPKEEEQNSFMQPKDDNVHTRMRMFMHLRQDLERVRNLCYMVSRREKLKLSDSKMHEQIFNLQVQLVNHEKTTVYPLSSALENSLFYPPPRITLKLKMPKALLGDCKTNSAKFSSQPLFSDKKTTSTVHSKRSVQKSRDSTEIKTKSYPRYQHGNRNNGLLERVSHSSTEAKNSGALQSTKFRLGQTSGKPLAIQAVLHGQSSNGSGKVQQRYSSSSRSNGVMETSEDIVHKDGASQTSHEQDSMLITHLVTQSNFRKSSIEHLSEPFKEVTSSLVKPTENRKSCEEPQRRHSMKERLLNKQTLEYQTACAPYQDNDGYCPDLELSDSEAESEENKEEAQLQGSSSDKESPSRDCSRQHHDRSKANMVSQGSMPR